MQNQASGFYERYLPWRRYVEIGLAPIIFAINGIANSATKLIDLRRENVPIGAWEPPVWEFSSAVLVLALLPAIAAFTRRFPLTWDTWRQRLGLHLLASFVFSVIHVAGMVALRMAAYRMQGEHYQFGLWYREFFYEYLKDIRTYALLVGTIETYRFIMRRGQGEASLLDAPDAGSPVEPVDKPERFLVRKLGREFLIAAADIEWLQASGNYVNLHVSGRDYPLRSTIAGIEERLDAHRFARVHRSYIVNLDRIASIEALDTGDAKLHLRDGSTIPCSRKYRLELRERIEGDAVVAS
jgi:LytTr DNA-binding domain